MDFRESRSILGRPRARRNWRILYTWKKICWGSMGELTRGNGEQGQYL